MLTPRTDAHQTDPLVITPEGDQRGPWARSWARIPVRGHVAYVLLGGDATVLYVGQTCRPRERLREHAKERHHLWQHVVQALIFPVADEIEARMAEYLLTERLRPSLNAMPSGRNLGRLRSLLAAEFAAGGAA